MGSFIIFWIGGTPSAIQCYILGIAHPPLLPTLEQHFFSVVLDPQVL